MNTGEEESIYRKTFYDQTGQVMFKIHLVPHY